MNRAIRNEPISARRNAGGNDDPYASGGEGPNPALGATKTQPTCADLAEPEPTYVGVLSLKISSLGLPGLDAVGFGASENPRVGWFNSTPGHH